MEATLPVIIDLVEAAITDVPQLIEEFQALFAAGAPTAAQFAALRAKVAAENFGS
jgi:hypothetical protein